ncbi:serine carboxypeptidase [Trifolium repens]|nr:serine carboxypeptidase [Trifolium repens]
MGFSKTSLSLLLLFILCSLYTTFRITQYLHFLSITNFSPNQRAEWLTRSLNLFLKEPVNIVHDDHSVDFVPGKIVEKKFSFFGDSDGLSVENIGHHAGYYSLPRSKDARLFYFFFKSRNSTNDDPVVIWLAGGPGCGGEVAVFYENGPFLIANNLSLVWNNYGWDKASNILFIDQPIGTGFSYANDVNDIPHDETGVSNDLYDFLQEFFKQHPEFIKNDFYITGESYAGHFAPALASRIQQGNKDNKGITINLKGFAIGNGLINPRIQYPTIMQYAFDMKLITKEDQEDLNKLILHECEDGIKNCENEGKESCLLAFNQCDIMKNILAIAGNINYFDIRKTCEGSLCYDFSKVHAFLNQKIVRDALGVGDMEFVICSEEVYDALKEDWMRNLEVDIPSLLEDGIKVLVYAGEFDLACNWLGISNWVHAMKWSSQNQFVASKSVQFLVDDIEAGLLKSYGPLSFLKVNGAGHMVPMDQPKAALEMLVNWMQGTLNETTFDVSLS